MDYDEQRICKVFNVDEVPEVTKENLLHYRKYLMGNFDIKSILTGREDFQWEEYYVMGPGDKNEYEKLKKTRPSYTDEYILCDISSEYVEGNDLIAIVKRLSDKKKFELELSWLKINDKKCSSYLLLEDFGTWTANW